MQGKDITREVEEESGVKERNSKKYLSERNAQKSRNKSKRVTIKRKDRSKNAQELTRLILDSRKRGTYCMEIDVVKKRVEVVVSKTRENSLFNIVLNFLSYLTLEILFFLV